MLNIFLLIIFVLIMFTCGIYIFCLNQNHLLLILLSLEFIILSLYSLLMFYLIWFSVEFYFGLFFLVMTVCEGALGLSLLVVLIRSYGNDYYQSFSMLW